MTYPADNSFDENDPTRDDIASEDAYARGASATDEESAEPAPGPSDAERALDEQRDKYLRLAAEYDNFRKRTAKERLDAGARAQGELVRQLIDSLDDLQRFSGVDPATTDATTVIQAVDLVEKKLHKVLGASGLEIIDPVDQAFDPTVHEAVMTEPALSSEDDHMVSRVFQRGYVFNGQLLRPARVVVKQWNG
jgi:molecular chaperone GrpE